MGCIAPRPDWVANRLGNGRLSHMLSNYWPVRAFNIAMNGGFPKADRSLSTEFGDTDNLIGASQDLKKVTSAVKPDDLSAQSLKTKHLTLSILTAPLSPERYNATLGRDIEGEQSGLEKLSAGVHQDSQEEYCMTREGAMRKTRGSKFTNLF
ncbi:uncharacterized protein MELLADRAFT_106817 [Melampsora larici-populina 98AG31]|uniref:Uncharacterized protein n=1 Tax=Melampsora larici-populina (strain 98AG31 / pathotype 3-4-7) TaxID=747676 RepID=F4RMR1_MELLP|nr:uncharacterized protein MELLADRAFT_106817 [Melampsora larici-populina 98AG31]EGG06153.1 hypothetical protein MELLADRAFT_106817 [Melampsora larici-populina 98AG31]